MAPNLERQQTNATMGGEDLADVLKRYKKMEEDDDGVEKPWIEKPPFQIFIGAIIMTNALTIGLETDNVQPDAVGIEDRMVWFVLENVFCVIFLGEMLLRLHYQRLGYFKELWNLCDFFLVILAITDTWILSLIIQSKEGNLRALSTLRVIRMMRLARLIRLLRSFKELWLIVNGLIESMKTLFWVSLLLVLVLYVCGIFLTMHVGKNDLIYMEYKKLSGGWDYQVYFGTVPASMYTLFQMVTLENWADGVARHVVSNQPMMALFFLVFLLLTTFGLLNLVVGVIVENTLTAAANNEEKIKRQQEKDRARTLEYLREIFELADEDKSGTLELEEFRNALEDPEVLKKLRMVDLPVQEAEALFMVLDADGSGSLSVDEFIGGCLRLKGNAKSKDLLAVQISVESMAKRIDNLEELLTENERKMDVLDKATIQMGRRYEVSVEEAHKRMAAAIGAGNGPVIASRRPANQGKTDFSIGNKPTLPPFPGFLQ